MAALRKGTPGPGRQELGFSSALPCLPSLVSEGELWAEHDVLTRRTINTLLGFETGSELWLQQ